MLRIQPLFKDSPAGFHLFLFLGLLVFGLLIGMLTGLVILHFSDGLSSATLINLEGPEALKAARIMQITSQLGLFFFPPLAYAFLISDQQSSFLGFNPIQKQLMLLPALMLMFASLPFIHFLSDLNKSIQFPEWLNAVELWMTKKEIQAEKLTEFFLSVDNIGGLFINLVMIALLPAIGEELVFRSVLQPKLIGITGKSHLGIILTALIFSIIHMQFYGILPRFVLGLFLGYFYYWSGSIIVPMLMHFINNGAAVLAFYMHHNKLSNLPMEDFGESSSAFILFTSLLFSLALISAGRYLGTDKK